MLSCAAAGCIDVVIAVAYTSQHNIVQSLLAIMDQSIDWWIDQSIDQLIIDPSINRSMID